MTRPTDPRRTAARLTPNGVFVVQLRANSDVRRRALRGRVEHVMSGQSEQFTSLADLLAFMARHSPAPNAPPPATNEGEPS
jgi:hypothetical protein